MKIRKAELSDLNPVCEIIDRCKEDMIDRRDEQWPNTHPSREKIEEGIERGEHFVAVGNKNILGGCGFATMIWAMV